MTQNKSRSQDELVSSERGPNARPDCAYLDCGEFSCDGLMDSPACKPTKGPPPDKRIRPMNQSEDSTVDTRIGAWHEVYALCRALGMTGEEADTGIGCVLTFIRKLACGAPVRTTPMEAEEPVGWPSVVSGIIARWLNERPSSPDDIDAFHFREGDRLARLYRRVSPPVSAEVEVARVIVQDGRIQDVEAIGPTPPDGQYALVPADPSFGVGEPWRATIKGVTGGQGLFLEGVPGSLNGWNWDGKLGREVTIRLVLRRTP